MDKKDYYVNIVALSEVFLEKYKDKINESKSLIIDLVNKDNTIVEKEILKNKLTDELVNIFDKNVSSLKEINLNCSINGAKTYLTGISIF